MAKKQILWLWLVLALLLSSDVGWTFDRAGLGRVLQAMPPNGPFWRYGNVVLRRNSVKAGLSPVVFPHWTHRAKFTCRVCHIELGFGMHAGDTEITRDLYASGKYCGACHDGKTSFSVQAGEAAQCGRCHMKNTDDLEEQFERFSADLPMASFGNGIDWAAALKDGLIKPKNTILAKGLNIQFPEKLEAPTKLGSNSPRSDVTFSHREHFAELDCSSCHPEVFNIKKKGTKAFTMESNVYGEFCGACHMQVAFPMNDCKRCHPQMSNSSRY